MTWEQFLRLASGPGWVNAAIAVLSAILVEYIPGFQALRPKWKRVVFFVISLAIPQLAALLGVTTLGWPGTWTDTFWPALLAGITAWLSGSGAHLLRKSPEKGIS